MSLPVSEHGEQTRSAPFTLHSGNSAARCCDTGIRTLGRLSWDRFGTHCLSSPPLRGSRRFCWRTLEKNSHKRSNDPHFVPDHFLLHIEEPESVPSSPRARLNVDSNTDHTCSSNLSIPSTGDQYLGSG